MRRSWLRLFWLTVVLVGVLAGYLVSSGLGTRLLHREIETQLTRLLEGPVVIGEVGVRWDDGLQVEAREVTAFPDPAGVAPPALRARRVLVWVDFVALLVGRLEMSTLLLEGPHVRIVQKADGSIVGLPIPTPSSYPDEGLEDRSEAEQLFARLAALDLTASTIAEEFRAADAVEIQDGTVEWIAARADGEPPQPLRVELLGGRAERHWLSEAIAVEFRGVFIDGVHAPFPFEIGLHREEGRHFVWSLAVSQIPLDAADSPLADLTPNIAGLTGTLDTRFRLRTEPDGVHHLTATGRIDDATITLRRSQALLEHARVDLEAQLVVDPVRIRLVSSRFEGPNVGIEFRGSIGRPIRPASRVRIEARTEDIDLPFVRDYAASIQDESQTAFTMARLTERVESGHVKYIEVAGVAPLRIWQDLASGRARELPTGFVLSGAVDDVDVDGGPDEGIEDISGEVEWVGDQIVFRNARGMYRGRPLPEMNAVVDGMSHLVRTTASARRISHSPPPLHGLDPLFYLLRPRNPDALPPVKAIGLAIDTLEHPIFRWPFRDLKVLVEPLRRGMEITVRDGLWGGAQVKGEVVWFTDPDAPSVSATLRLAAPDVEEGTASPAAAELEAGTPSPAPPAVATNEGEPPASPLARNGRWGAGRFEMEFRPRRWLPFEHATGFVRLEGTQVFLDELEVRVKERGTLAARLGLDLDRVESIGFDTTFALTESRLQEIGPFVALPEGLGEGSIDATGSLAGRVRPKTSFIAELDGRVRADARNGRVLTSVPLMFRLAKATEGYNPFAGEDELQFEAMSGTFEIEQGVISVEDFQIEGPLRVFAKADINTLNRPGSIRAVVGIFLFRRTNQFLENLPLVRAFLPGSERGLIGTYFEVNGPLDAPEVEALALQTLMTSIPDVIKAPFKALRFLFEGSQTDS